MKKSVAACICALSFFAFAQSGAKPKKISAAEAQKMITAGNVIILDVRTREEYAEGHISNAVLLPDFEIQAKAAEILPDKNAVILVHCRSGVRSAAAAKTLTSLGYNQIYDFGGIIDWKGKIVK